jgi:hypothetical protein
MYICKFLTIEKELGDPRFGESLFKSECLLDLTLLISLQTGIQYNINIQSTPPS